MLPMNLLAFGINHKTAPLEIRERLLFTPETTPQALQQLMLADAVNEAVILSTCNRTELYCDTQNAEPVTHWLANYHQLPHQILSPHLYYHQQEQAVRHILRVTSGLDSMVLGEPQIFGQVKTAFATAQQIGTVGTQLEHLFRAVFTITKQIRTETGIGANAISVAYAVITLAKQIFAEITQSTALLIGAGQTIELVATHLYNQGIKKLIIANRSVDKAWQLANKFNAQGIAIGEIPLYLNQAEIVVAATHSPLPILGKGAVETALKQRKHRPMLMIDMSVPRNIESEISHLEDIYLYNLDDLQNIIAENLKSREIAAKQAEILIDLQTEHFMRELRALESVDIIRAYREKVSEISAKELAKAMQQLQQGKTPEQILISLVHQLTQKILHAPTTTLRQAAYEGQLELLILARKLFGL